QEQGPQERVRLLSELHLWVFRLMGQIFIVVQRFEHLPGVFPGCGSFGERLASLFFQSQESQQSTLHGKIIRPYHGNSPAYKNSQSEHETKGQNKAQRIENQFISAQVEAVSPAVGKRAGVIVQVSVYDDKLRASH